MLDSTGGTAAGSTGRSKSRFDNPVVDGTYDGSNAVGPAYGTTGAGGSAYGTTGVKRPPGGAGPGPAGGDFQRMSRMRSEFYSPQYNSTYPPTNGSAVDKTTGSTPYNY